MYNIDILFSLIFEQMENVSMNTNLAIISSSKIYTTMKKYTV